MIDPDSISEAQRVIRERICQHRIPFEIKCCHEEQSRLLDLIQRTAKVGESNSLLVIGPRGSGKTVILNQILQELKQNKEVRENLLEVKLNGLVQTDDRIALKEITRQLKLENTVGDKVFGSFAENLQFLLESLKSGNQGSKSIVFILDEFDLFTFHKNQTLLYNLFDVSQSAQTPICVIGLTCRLDVTELLEKRVKSRFSHRQIYLFNNFSFTEYCDIFERYLTLPADFTDKSYAKKWNSHIHKLRKDSAVVDILKKQYHLSKDIRALQALMYFPVFNTNVDQPFLEAADFLEAVQTLSHDTKSSMLQGISILELCLMIAMKHLDEIYEGEPFNFEMVYDKYKQFSQKKSTMQTFERAVVLKAYEHLVALELIRPADGGTKTQKEFKPMNLLIDGTQIDEAVKSYPNCPTEIKQWSKSMAMA
ncbi:origin recognition complex subunit 4-like [Tubulanus polymorphus]|uniref:origin recognition complex subunit 4-like n=1 Tax=Tubulanus polymorphus TaxID=672921 RepID=UPI003DA4DF31